MRLIQGTGIESPLPYVAARRLRSIPVRRIASVRLLERLRERPKGVRNSNQMHMIRHQAVSQQGKAIKLGVLAQQLKIGDAIVVAGEDDLSGIAALRNMMGNIDDHDAGQPSHRKKLNREDSAVDNGWLSFSVREFQIWRKQPGYVPSVPTFPVVGDFVGMGMEIAECH
jgi:hypothetical protein